MSEETQVSIQSADNGTKNQWAKGLFYRQDGRKRVLVPKRLLWVGGTAFAVLAIAIIIQGAPEPMTNDRRNRSEIAAPDTVGGQTVVDVPAAVQSEVSTASDGANTAKTTQKNAGKSGEKKSKFTGPQLVSRPRSGKIPPGSLVKAALITGASNGPVRAEVTDGLSVNGETLIEQGAILLGTGQSGEDRLNIRFSQIVHGDGAFETIDAQACDAGDKIPGLKGSKVGSRALKLATGIGLNFVGGMTTALEDTQGEGGAVLTRPSLKDAMLNGAATATLDQGREVLSDARNKVPVIEVPAGTPIYVLLQGS